MAAAPLTVTPDFEAIHAEYAGLVRRIVFRLCHPNDLDDLVQQVFVKVFEHRDHLKDPGSLKAWICRIAVNTARDDLRRRRRAGWLSLSAPEDLDRREGPGTDAGSALAGDQLVRRAVGALSPKLREVVVLYSLKELEVKEIAETLGLPEGTVKSRLSQAREKLRDVLRVDHER